MEFNTISVVGLGYIGLPTAAAFASKQVNVIGVDVDQGTVDTINRGKIHIIEPGLDEVVREAVLNGCLKATTVPEPADAFLIAVPTPFKGNNHEPDLSYIKSASKAIASVLKKGDIVILESTSPVGATEQMADWLAEARADLSFPQAKGELSDIRIAHCPERVLPGKVMRELVENDRVIGGMTQVCSERAIELYKIFVKGECFVTNSRTAEMAKLTENSFRDVNIAFANELSVICERLDISVWELIRLANRHPRVDVLQPGPGVGGHCIAVDPWFIVSKTPEEAKLIRLAREVNDNKPLWVLSKLEEQVEALMRNGVHQTEINIVCYGLAFKPNIDDLRESPALQISLLAEKRYGRLLIVEPNIESLPSDFKLSKLVRHDEIRAVENTIVLMLVKHTEFIGMNFAASTVLIDACGVSEKG